MKHYNTDFLREERLLAEAKKGVWKSSVWYSAADIASHSAEVLNNISFQPSEWVRTGQIFSVRDHDNDYYPGYGLDIRPDKSVQPYPAMAEVVRVLQRQKNSWGMAFWFASVNSYLGNRRPQDLLNSGLSRVVAAAEYEVAGITHG